MMMRKYYKRNGYRSWKQGHSIKKAPHNVRGCPRPN